MCRILSSENMIFINFADMYFDLLFLTHSCVIAHKPYIWWVKQYCGSVLRLATLGFSQIFQQFESESRNSDNIEMEKDLLIDCVYLVMAIWQVQQQQQQQQTRLDTKVFSLERIYLSSPVEFSKSQTSNGSKRTLSPKKLWAHRNFASKFFFVSAKNVGSKNLGSRNFL